MSSGRVFLSYAKEDADPVARVHARLQTDGFQPWIDQHDLLPGQEWEHAIRNAIRQSSAFVVFLSRNAVSKTGFIQKEIREALEVTERMPQGQVFIVPARLEDCVVPEPLRRWQWIDLFRRGGYGRMRDTLTRQLGIIPRRRTEVSTGGLNAFTSPVDHLLFDLLRESGRFLYARTDRQHFAVGQGHFLLVRKGPLAPFRSLRNVVGDFRRLPPEALEMLFAKSAPWRKPAALLRRILFKPDLDAILLESEERICEVNPAYWRFATLAVPGARTYLSGDNDPIYLEQGDSPRMVVMPLRMSDEERAMARADAGPPSPAAQPRSGADPGTWKVGDDGGNRAHGEVGGREFWTKVIARR